MSDLIKREDAIKAIKQWRDNDGSLFDVGLNQAIREIKRLPSADRPQGEWKPFDLKWGRSVWYCSACEESTEVPTYLGKPMYNFCPMCGANMNMKKADGCKTEPNSSEKLNNCEHITEDGVTCAKYPASCQYPQVFWIYKTNDYDENILAMIALTTL